MRSIDILYTPWCFVELPGASYKEMLADQFDVTVREFNIWDIDDDLSNLPAHIATTVERARNPDIAEMTWYTGGTLFFLDGVQLELSPDFKWPQVVKILEHKKETK
jgi:hypothetical protein